MLRVPDVGAHRLYFLYRHFLFGMGVLGGADNAVAVDGWGVVVVVGVEKWD